MYCGRPDTERTAVRRSGSVRLDLRPARRTPRGTRITRRATTGGLGPARTGSGGKTAGTSHIGGRDLAQTFPRPVTQPGDLGHAHARTKAAAVHHVQQVLGRDVAGGGRGEGATTEPTQTGIEHTHTRLHRGQCVGVTGVTAVVEMTAQRTPTGHLPDPTEQFGDLARHPDRKSAV